MVKSCETLMEAKNFVELMALMRGFEELIQYNRRRDGHLNYYVFDGRRVGGGWDELLVCPAEDMGREGFGILSEFAHASRFFKLRAAGLTGFISV